MTFANLSTTGTHAVTIEWDTTKLSTHAIDYLTTFNRTVTTANPCLGVTGCSPGTFTTFAIPADSQVTGGGVTPVVGDFRLYGGTITGLSAYSRGAGFPTGDLSRRITINFTAGRSNPVLAWGGHISTRQDWGLGNSAVAMPGTPYHTRLIDLDGDGSTQDHSLSADAVIFPGSLTIIEQATPEGSTSFPYTASPSPLTSFSLADDGTTANTQLFSNITTFQPYTVNETPLPDGWTVTSVTCSVTSPNGGTSSTSNTTATINMNEGENWTCTYANSLQQAHLIVIEHVINDNGGTKVAGDFAIHAFGGSANPASFPGAETPGTDVTITALPAGTRYHVSGDAVSGYTGSFSADCSGTILPGQTKTCTATSDDIAPHLIVIQHVVNDNGGTKTAADFALTI